MALWQGFKRRAKLVIAPLCLLCMTGYFVWNVTQGNHGLVAKAQREEMLRQVQAENVAAVTERDGWEHRVSGLRSNHLDPDTLDERARAMLNLAEPTDVVVQYAPKDKLF